MAQCTQVVFGKRAKTAIETTTLHIEESGYPDTAIDFAQRLSNFGYTLADFPNKYPLCRFLRFSKRNYRCAVFESNYIYVYKQVKNQLRIYNIIHTKRLK
jgi:plasmid stabilization system protein ParE